MDVRIAAISVINVVDRRGLRSVPTLRAALQEKGLLRWKAAMALAGLGRGEGVVLPVLMEAFQKTRPRAAGKGEVGPGEKGRALRRSLRLRHRGTLDDVEWHQELDAREFEALQSLNLLPPETPGLLGALLQLLHHGKTQVRAIAAQTLAKACGAAARAVMKALMETLPDENAFVRASAAAALGMLGPPAAVSGPGLIGLLADKSGRVRSAAITALGQIGPGAAAAVPALIKALGDTDRQVRSNVLQSLGGMGLQAGAAVPALVDIIMSGNEPPEMRDSAGSILWKIGPEAEIAVPLLLNAFAEVPVSREVSNAFQRIRPVSPRVVKYLVEAVENHSNLWVRTAAVNGLKQLGPAARDGVPALLGLLKSADRRSRLQAMLALGSIGPQAQAAVPALLEVLNDSDAVARSVAARTLGRIRVADKAAVHRLVQALRDGDEQVRAAALDALYEMG
ncbi:MAG: HEAT repeat domain-containing protein [Acidobacteriota bacterium]